MHLVIKTLQKQSKFLFSIDTFFISNTMFQQEWIEIFILAFTNKIDTGNIFLLVEFKAFEEFLYLIAGTCKDFKYLLKLKIT